QAGDGIRDFHVTGVQTCALPISFDPRLPRQVPAIRVHLAGLGILGGVAAALVVGQAVALATTLAAAAQGRLATGALLAFVAAVGSEERRAGKECRSRMVERHPTK